MFVGGGDGVVVRCRRHRLVFGDCDLMGVLDHFPISLILPVSYLGAALILLRASLAHWRRAPIEWRGRRYPR